MAAQELMGSSSPHDFNQAIMEFGSQQCTPRPVCGDCPLCQSCHAFGKGVVSSYPVKVKKSKPKERFFHYYHILQGENTWLMKRNGNDIWRNLYEFPMAEAKKFTKNGMPLPVAWLPVGAIIGRRIEFRHQLTHQTIHAVFHEVILKGRAKPALGGLIRVPAERISQYPLHRLMEKYLEKH